MTRLVCLDPGHGGSDSGAVAGGIRESDLNLRVVREVAKQITAQGLRVIQTHNGMPSTRKLYNYARCAVANKARADVFLAVHNNASVSVSARGFEVIHAPASLFGTAFAKLLSKELDAMPEPDIDPRSRSIITDDDTGRGPYTVLRQTVMPACLVELAFLTNAGDRAFVTSPSGITRLASALARALVQFCKQ